jgi:GTP-binding protein Era
VRDFTVTQSESKSEADYRAGFVAIVGRPNTGKSTLTNALVGHKVAITSKHPNTTRNAIRGIVTTADFQMILVDTPGLHKPKTLLGTQLNAVVAENIDGVDAVLLCLPADEDLGSGDEFIARQISSQRSVFIALTKTDRVDKEKLMPKLQAISEMIERTGLRVKEIVPVSASHMEQVGLLQQLLADSLPVSPPLYPDDITTDQASEFMICELIREAAIADLYQEVPHSVVVTIDEMNQREGKEFFDIYATIHVERDSQKAIIIGPGGSRLKEIGIQARRGVENFLGAKAYLALHVKITKNWQQDPKALNRLGFNPQK